MKCRKRQAPEVISRRPGRRLHDQNYICCKNGIKNVVLVLIWENSFVFLRRSVPKQSMKWCNFSFSITATFMRAEAISTSLSQNCKQCFSKQMWQSPYQINNKFRFRGDRATVHRKKFSKNIHCFDNRVRHFFCHHLNIKIKQTGVR